VEIAVEANLGHSMLFCCVSGGGSVRGSAKRVSGLKSCMTSPPALIVQHLASIGGVAPRR